MKLKLGFKLLVCTVLFTASIWTGRAEAATIAFDEFGLMYGSAISAAVDAQYLMDSGLTIIADNLNIPGRPEEAIFDSTHPIYEAMVFSGNNSASRMDPITSAQSRLSQFDRVEINFGGSAAVDNIGFNPVPEPASMLLVGSSLIVLAGIARKKIFKKNK